jgi:hypothetical protein
LSIGDTFHGISTIITSIIKPGEGSMGSGFFYNELSEEKYGPDKGWIAINNTWLVTNRHVLLPSDNGKENTPNQLIFHVRKINGASIKWEPIILDRLQIISRVRVHHNRNVDVAVVQVLDLLKDKLNSEGNYMNWFGVDKGQFAGKNNIHVDVGDEALIIGYPRGYYDKVNLYPIVKSGIIASGWGLPFDGEPKFLIDAKLFPGSSGSLVVSRPIDMAVKNKQLMYRENKQFAFLGILSHDLSDYNMAIVWYASLVEEIIRNGQSILS